MKRPEPAWASSWRSIEHLGGPSTTLRGRLEFSQIFRQDRPVATAASERPSTRDAAAGQEAAERLAREWPDVSWVPEAPSVQWANAAVERFAELVRGQEAIFRASQRNADRGAASLSPRPFQGIVEALQNADDLGASELRLAVRRNGRRRELLMVHEGERVRLDHVGAMALPWLTTKDDDPDASGRFGIGQKTLGALGGPLEVHCAPFQFRLAADGPVVVHPVPAIKGFYVPSRHETLFLVPLLPTVQPADLETFVTEELTPRSLLFLRTVRRISLVDLATARRKVDHRLIDGERSTTRLSLARHRLEVERLELRDPRSRRRYARYMVDRPLTREEQRHGKATGPTTPLGVALPLSGAERGGFYDRLRLPLAWRYPASLNAQFDPDAARTTVLQNDWNERRIEDLGEFVSVVALHSFGVQERTAWRAVPLRDDLPDEQNWFHRQLERSVVDAVQARLADQLRLELQGRRRSLKQIVFEQEELDGLLTVADQQHLKPGHYAIPQAARDAEGRWREVLVELDRSSSITLDEALELFGEDDDQLGERDPRWFVEIAAAFAESDSFRDFLYTRSILLADGRRIEPPGGADPRSLVKQIDKRSLAAVLDVAQQIHPAYLTDDDAARSVVETLAGWDVLTDEVDTADGVLRVLARDHSGNTIGRIQIDDEQLILLRDAFEQLSEEEQKLLGPRIGMNIGLRGFEFDGDDERIQTWVAPGEAYLPREIDRETDSFARAAGKTAGISWLDNNYAKLLRREGGRRELGAQKFLSRLGAAIAPRLVAPQDEASRWKTDARPASKIDAFYRPTSQRLEINALTPRPTYLLDDKWSPDLEAVTADIAWDEGEPAHRARRGIALLGVLARSWDRVYADHETASAVYASGGQWLNPRAVTATWLARASDEAWLPAADGTLSEPANLSLPTEANKLIADGGTLFLADVEEDVLRSQALPALKLRRGPSAQNLVTRLRELREQKLDDEIAAEARTIYQLLALACPPEGVRRPVDDMSVTDLRAAFAGGRGRRGLLLVGWQWLRPIDAFSGEPIFGAHRPFAPAGAAFARLWRTLEIGEPTAQDCVAVLRELTKTPLADDDRAIVLATVRRLAASLDELSPQARAQLARLPVWTGRRWRTNRPIFAIEDPELADQVARQEPVWQSNLISYVGCEPLLEALKVTLVGLDQFEATGLKARSVVAGEDLRPRFARAVVLLREGLFRGDKALLDSITVTWKELASASVIIEPSLRLTTTVSSLRLTVEAHAHVRREPLAFIVRSVDDIGNAQTGGRAIASLFMGDRQKIAWAWQIMWQQAGEPATGGTFVTIDEEPVDDGASQRLIDLKGQAKERDKQRRRRGRGRGGEASNGAQDRSGDVRVKPLKDLSELEPDAGAIVNAGASAGGVHFPAATPAGASGAGGGSGRGGGSGGNGGGGDDGRGGGGQSARRTQHVLPTTDTREQLALDAVMEALRLDPPQVADLRSRRGIGADMMDELRQFFEMKMSSSSSFPPEITLTRSEVQRAQTDPDFFLALVAGLEEAAGELRVRFIFNPLDRSGVRIKGEVTLTGLKDIEALEYRFARVDGSAARDSTTDT